MGCGFEGERVKRDLVHIRLRFGAQDFEFRVQGISNIQGQRVSKPDTSPQILRNEESGPCVLQGLPRAEPKKLPGIHLARVTSLNAEEV